MRKLLTLTAALVLLTTPLLAQQHETDDVETVILASTENYPDAMVASSAASKIGAPILLTDEDELPQEVGDAIQRMDPSEIILVGGDEVISDNVKARLEQENNVTRLWGVTRYGTAVEIAEYFWQEGADSALLVENEGGDDERVLGLAKSIARSNGEPVFLAPSEKIPASVMSALEGLGVSEVGFVGGELSEEATGQLNELGISVRDTVGTDDEELGQEVRERLRDRINTSQEFIVVGASDFRHSLAGTTDPRSNSYIVGNDDDIDSVVTFINNESIENVRVVGSPDMVGDIAEAVREGTEADVTVRGMAADEVASSASNVTGKEIAEIARAQNKARARWKEDIQQNMERLERKANRTVARAKDLARDMNASNDTWNDINEAEAALAAGEYQEAYEDAREIVSEFREKEWDDVRTNPEQVRDRARGETADLQEQVNDLGEINREFAEEMSQNLTVEERLEIINEFREKRREAVQELVEEARGRRGDMMERLREAERRVDGDIRVTFEQECADEDNPGIGNMTAEFSGHDGYLRVRGELGLSTPNYQGQARATVDRESRTVTVRLGYSDVTRGGDVGGIQCTGVSEYEVRKYVSQGNWTVKLTAQVDEQRVATASGMVTVLGDDDDDEREREDDSSLAPMIEAQDQRLENDGSVEVEGYLNEPGYIVLHTDDGGQPGEIVSTSDLLEGEFDTSVPLNMTGTFWAVLHYDDGDGEFTASADSPVMRLNRTVQQQFAAKTGAENRSGVDEDENVVTYTSDGFSPSTITIKQGETVTWESKGPDMWVGSNEHPTHTNYAGTSRSEHCADDSTAATRFDSCADVDEYEFTFNKTGEWGYHNHLLTGHTGTVVVKE